MLKYSDLFLEKEKMEIKIRPGYLIENYVLEEMIGAGGFSTVYKARSINPEPLYSTIIAVKVLHPRRLSRSQIKQFVKEAKIAKTLNHENIVKVYDVKKKEGNFFILMEYLDIDLLKAIRTKPYIFTPERINEIILKVIKGLAFIHNQGIVHKDVTPSNVLISFSFDKVKITDFGLARRRGILGIDRDKSGGTNGYIAPERFMGKKADIRTDIYSLGKTIEKIYNELKFEIPPEIKYIIDMATNPDPEKRFQNVETILYFLKFGNSEQL